MADHLLFAPFLEAAEVGWKFGDEIVEVNHRPVCSREDGSEPDLIYGQPMSLSEWGTSKIVSGHTLPSNNMEPD